MFLFSVGTVPLLLGFGAVSALLSARFTRRLAMASGVLVAALGLVMFARGLGLFGIALPRMGPAAAEARSAVSGRPAAALPDGAAVARVSGGAQEVTTRVLASSYQPFVVQAGLPVRWTIEVKPEDLNGCNNALVVPAYGIRKKLAPGKNVVEFTPDREGTFAYTCWMGMIRSTIRVVPDLSRVSSADLPPADGAPAGRAAIAAGLAAPGAGFPTAAGSPAGAACACCATP